jgi:hypothetical protein
MSKWHVTYHKQDTHEKMPGAPHVRLNTKQDARAAAEDPPQGYYGVVSGPFPNPSKEGK